MPSKRYKKAATMVEGLKTYPLKSAVEVLSKFPKAKFNETVDLAFRLGVDPKQSDQMVRGTVPLPHGSGKTVRVLVFARSGPAAEAAKAAGAEFVGFEDMIKKCQDGWTDFDVAVATPEAMGEVRKLGKVLGPRGLMPSLGIGHQTARAENFSQLSHFAHRFWSRNGDIKIRPAILAFLDHVLEADELRASRFCGFGGGTASGKNEDADGLAAAVGERNRATDHLIRLLGIHAQAKGEVNGFVELGFGKFA